VLSRPEIIDALLTLMLRMGQWPCCYLFSQYKRPIRPLCITTTKSLVNYRTYKTTNRWRSVDAHCNVLFIQHLLPPIIVFILIWLYRLSFWLIKTRPRGKAERRNHVALFTLTRLKLMYHAKRFMPKDSCQKIHCACYASIYEPIFTSYFLPFAHNTSLTETPGQAK